MAPPFDDVRSLAADRIEAFRGQLREDNTFLDSVYQSARQVSGEIGRDYGDRFLYELVQNAYDAQGGMGNGGEIDIVLDSDDGPHGTLYVANRGTPFTARNLKALCSLASSDKLPGQVVGNKGVGFRSVLHVTEDPRVFSQSKASEATDHFAGRSFRFARGVEDFRLFAPGIAALLADHAPPFWLPVSLGLEDQSPRVRAWAARGFATVIAIPLRSPGAYGEALRACRRLRTDVPLLLFLRDAGHLSVEVANDADASFTLTRRECPLRPDPSGSERSLGLVDLGEEGRFLLARAKIAEHDVGEAVDESIRENKLDARWKSAVGPSEVSLAVPLGETLVDSGRVYTYLPMETPAPLHGHLHAPFVTKLDRRHLHSDVPLNGLYLREAARLAAETAVDLASTSNARGLDDPRRRAAVVNFVAWADDPDLRVGPPDIATHINRDGSSSHPIVPTLRGWLTPQNAKRWPPSAVTAPLELFAPERMTEIGVGVIHTDLGAARTDRLVRFLEAIGCRPESTPDERAEWAEAVAEGLPPSGADDVAPEWRAFYVDIPKLFQSAGPLSGRRVLGCADGILRPVQPREEGRTTKAVFLPPSGRGTDGASLPSIPSALRKRLAVLADVGWYDDELRDALNLFTAPEGGVGRYVAADMVRHVAASVRRSRSRSFYGDALKWTFAVFQQLGTGPLRNITLRVPTVSEEWIRSNEAVFAAGWPLETRGPDLEAWLFTIDGSADDEIQAVAAARLAPPEQFGSREATPVDETSAWAEFLSAIGVQRGLPLKRLQLGGQAGAGRRFTPRHLAEDLGLSEGVRAQWMRAWKEEGSPRAKHTGQRHRALRDLRSLVGQGAWEGWSDESKELYAVLVIGALADHRITEGDVRASFKHDYKDSRHSFSTPLGAFLRCEPWFPLRSRADEGLRFVRPSEVWLPSEKRLPSFLPRPSRRVAPHLTPPAMQELRRFTGAGVWGDDSPSRTVADLPRRFLRSEVPSHAEAELANAYADAWLALAREDSVPEWGDRRRSLLITAGGHMQAYDIDADTYSVVVPDTAYAPTIDLLESLERPVFAAARSSAAPHAVTLLSELLGERCVPASEVDVNVLVDGTPADPESDPPLGVQAPAVEALLLLAAASLPPAAANTLPRDRAALVETFSAVRVATGTRVEGVIGGEAVALPSHLGGALPFRQGDSLAVAVERGRGEWERVTRVVGAAAGQLNRTVLTQPFELAALFAEKAGLQPDRPPHDEGLSRIGNALRLSDADITAALAPLRDRSRRFAELFDPLAVALGGERAASALEDLLEGAAPDERESVVAALLPAPGPDAAAIAEAARTSDSLAVAAQRFPIELSSLNRALARLGRSPVSREDSHRRALTSYLSAHRDEALNRLRAPYVDLFRSGGLPTAYARARDAYGQTEPDSGWHTSLWALTPDLLRSHYERRVSELGAAEADAVADLEPAPSLRASNTDALRTITGRAARHIAAHVPGVPPTPWDTDDVFPTLLEALDVHGVLDFEALSTGDFLEWIQTLGLWPEGVPASLPSEAHSSLPDTEDEERRSRERAERARRHRLVSVDGTEVDPLDFDVHVSAIDEALSRAVSGLPRGPVTPTHAPPPERVETNHSRSGGGKTKAPRSVDPDKTGFIGLLGERAVYLWLGRSMDRTTLDAGWRSPYRERYIGGEGDDSLGADFLFEEDGRARYIEVKAHLDDPWSFELAPSEIRRALSCAQSDEATFEVAYVTNVANPTELKIEFFPNPLGSTSALKFAKDNQRVRFRFVRQGP